MSGISWEEDKRAREGSEKKVTVGQRKIVVEGDEDMRRGKKQEPETMEVEISKIR